MGKGNEKGFTLIDVVVVVSVIAILVAVLSPYITRYIDDSKIAKARNETQGIGGALTNFNKDVVQWPKRNPTDGAGVINVHYTGILPPNHAAYPDLINGKTGWSGPYAAIDNSILSNGTSGSLYPVPPADLAWKGPYASSSLPMDPWGRPYLINVPATGPIWVMSAGPNRRLDTNATDNVVAADDIGFRVR